MPSRAPPPQRHRRSLFGAAAAAASAAFAGAARAQTTAAPADYPNRPVRLVVPWAPGGLTDIPARLLAAGMTRRLNQPVVVENRPGATGTVGTALVRGSPPDGYALFYANAASHAQAPALRRNVPYDPVADFAPVVLAVVSPFAIVVRPDRGLRGVPDLVALARREGRATFGTTGPGGTGHLLALLLSRATGAVFEPVHFNGDAPAIQEVLAGRLDMHYAAAVRAQVEAGQLHVAATTGAARWSLFPDAPTLLEAGIPGTDLQGWNGIVAPAGTPPGVVARLNAAAVAALAEPETRDRLAVVGLEPAGGPPDRFAAHIAAEFARYRRIGQEFGIALD